MPHGDPDPRTFLEPDQLRADRTRPLPRAPLSRGVTVGLWALRLAVVVSAAMVLYVFIDSLG